MSPRRTLRFTKMHGLGNDYVYVDLFKEKVPDPVPLAVAVSDAVVEVKRTAHYITTVRGGEGAIREVVELILKSQGKWKKAVPLAIA